MAEPTERELMDQLNELADMLVSYRGTSLESRRIRGIPEEFDRFLNPSSVDYNDAFVNLAFLWVTTPGLQITGDYQAVFDQMINSELFSQSADQLGEILVYETLLNQHDPGDVISGSDGLPSMTYEEVTSALTRILNNPNEMGVQAWGLLKEGAIANQSSGEERDETEVTAETEDDPNKWRDLEQTLSIRLGSSNSPEIMDWIHLNRSKIQDEWKRAKEVGEVDKQVSFSSWFLDNSIYSPTSSTSQIYEIIESEGPVNVNGPDILDNMINDWLPRQIGGELRLILGKELKRNIENQLTVRGTQSQLSKVDIFDLLGFEDHEQVITNTLASIFEGAQGGTEFIEALEGRGFTLGQFITNTDWATLPYDEPVAGFVDAAPFPDAFTSLRGLIENLNTHVSTSYGVPALVLVNEKEISRRTFLHDQFADSLSSFPPFIRNIVMGLIEDEMVNSDIDHTKILPDDLSKWFQGRGGFDNFIDTGIEIALGDNVVDGGSRKLAELRTAMKNTQSSLAEAFNHFWKNAGLKDQNPLTATTFRNLLLSRDLIPKEPEDPDEIQQRIDDESFAAMLRPIVDGLPAKLGIEILNNAQVYYQGQLQLNPNEEPEDILDLPDFDTTIRSIAEDQVSRYFGDDETMEILVEAAGGVRKFFDLIKDELPNGLETDRRIIVDLFKSQEGLDIIDRVSPFDISDPMDEGRADLFDEYRTQVRTSIEAERKALEAGQLDEAKADTAAGIRDALAQINLDDEASILEFFESAEGQEYLTAVREGRIEDFRKDLKQRALEESQLETRETAAQIEFEKFKRITEWLVGDEGQTYLDTQYGLDERERVVSQLEQKIDLDKREELLNFFDRNPEILKAQQEDRLAELVKTYERRSTLSEYDQLKFADIQRFVNYYSSPEGKQFADDQFELEMAQAAQALRLGFEELTQREIAADLTKEITVPQLLQQLDFERTQFAGGLREAEFEREVEGRIESLFMPQLQERIEREFGRRTGADVLGAVSQQAFQEYLSQARTEISREQRTGLIRFDPDVEMHPLEGRPLRPEERADYYTPESFVSRIRPDLFEEARRQTGLERLRPFRTPTPRRQRRNLLGGIRSFAGAGT